MSRTENRQFRDKLFEALSADNQTLDQKLEHAIEQHDHHNSCYVFDFDDTLVELTKVELEYPDHDDFELNEHTQPIEVVWDILKKHAKPNGHVIILTGRDKMSTIDWLRVWDREHLIDKIYSCSDNLDNLAHAKKHILSLLSDNYDSICFIDNNDSNLMAATQIPGLTVCKVSDLKDRTQETGEMNGH